MSSTEESIEVMHRPSVQSSELADLRKALMGLSRRTLIFVSTTQAPRPMLTGPCLPLSPYTFLRLLCGAF